MFFLITINSMSDNGLLINKNDLIMSILLIYLHLCLGWLYREHIFIEISNKNMFWIGKGDPKVVNLNFQKKKKIPN